MGLLIVLPSERDLLATRRLDDKEDNKAVMHALDSDVFHYCCSHTDWASGMIGQHFALSYYRIASALTEDIPRKPSRSLRKVNRNDVRNSVKRLVRVGLLINVSTSGEKQNRLCLRRPFWEALFSAKNRENNVDTQQLSGFMTELSKRSAFNNAPSADNSPSDRKTSHAAHATYKSININDARARQFCMTLTWQPERDYVDKFLEASGFSGKQIKKIWFGKYVQYWSQRTITRTQRDWSAHFANHMQSYLLRPNYFEKQNGMLDDEATKKPVTTNARFKSKVKKTKKTSVKQLRVPSSAEGAYLQQWALTHGLPASPVGFSTEQYRQWLCNQVERMNGVQDAQAQTISGEK